MRSISKYLFTFYLYQGGMKLYVLILSLIIMATVCKDVDAQGRQRLPNQNLRIKQGVRSGELTRAETVRLAMNRRHLRHDVRQAISDSVITRNERREIRRELRRSSRAIYRKKHNRRDRV